MDKLAPCGMTEYPNSGSYNDAPPNWEEVTEAEFCHLPVVSMSVEFMETRQVLRVGKKRLSSMVQATMFWVAGGEGWAISRDYSAGKVRYFKFAVCKHVKVKLTNLGRCYNRYTCEDCGYAWEVDSSD